MKAGTIFLLMTLTCALLQATPSPAAACQIMGLSVASPIPSSVAQVQALAFSSAIVPAYSNVFFTLTNLRQAPLTAATILLEFLDAKGNWLVSVPVSYTEHTNPEALPLKLSDPPYLVKILADPIPGGGSRQLFGLSPIVVSHCPRSVRISFAKLIFGDSYSYSYSNNKWLTDAVLIKVAAQQTPPETSLPSYVVVRGNIDVSGKLKNLQVRDRTGQLDEGWLKKETESWSFTPARINARSITMPQTFIVRFHSGPKGDTLDITRHLLTAVKAMPRKFAVIDLVPDAKNHGWELFYASNPLSP